MLRTQLHRALVDQAKQSGVVIETNSNVVSADPAGSLTLDDGRVLKADFVAGADGYHSKVRDSLALAEKVDTVSTSYVGRTVIPRTAEEQEEFGCENWSGPRRLCIMTCGREYLNLFLSSPENPDEVDAKTVLEVLTVSAMKLGAKAPDDQFGWGLIDPVSALEELEARLADNKLVASAKPATQSSSQPPAAKPAPKPATQSPAPTPVRASR